jgi:N-glycosylase/DNA lyase
MGRLCRLGAFGEALVPQRGKRADHGLQVLFTADLKAFSDYGLPTPTPSPSKVAAFSQGKEDYFSAPIHPQRKKRAKKVRSQDALGEGSASYTDVSPAEPSSLAERIKRRRRK